MRSTGDEHLLVGHAGTWAKDVGRWSTEGHWPSLDHALPRVEASDPWCVREVGPRSSGQRSGVGGEGRCTATLAAATTATSPGAVVAGVCTMASIVADTATVADSVAKIACGRRSPAVVAGSRPPGVGPLVDDAPVAGGGR
jgi:hypothetical protein